MKNNTERSNLHRPHNCGISIGIYKNMMTEEMHIQREFRE